MAHVRVLAARIGPRPAGSGAYGRALTYVRRALARLGYRTREEPFVLPQGGRSANVVAGIGNRADPIVLGAHLDTVPLSPGGNDNASGVAVLLEVARALAGTRYAADVTFVAFGAEERQPDESHHIGSEHFVEELPRRELRGIRAMLSIDMIGTNAPIIVGTFYDDVVGATPLVVRAARRADIRIVGDVVGDVSDHGPFALAGVPAVLLWTGLEPYYHSPGDVVGNVDLAALRNAGRLVIGVVRAALRR